MRKAQWAAHDEWGEEDTRRLEELRGGFECLYVDAYCRDADGFDGAGEMTHGHMTDWSARGEEDGVDAIVFEHLRPLRGRLVAQASDIGQAVVGIVARGECSDEALFRKLAEAGEGEDDVVILLGGTRPCTFAGI